MSDFVADTMALVLRLEKRRMSDTIKEIFKKAESNEINVYIPAIVLAEIGYLAEKSRIETGLHEVEDYCKLYSSIQILPMDFSVVKNTFVIDDIVELHDRIIAASALTLNLGLITNDPIIQRSRHIRTVW